MIKLLIIGGLAFLLYRLIVPRKAIDLPNDPPPPPDEQADFVEYEEIDD